MSIIVDKRFLPKNQTVGSRQKFIDRYKGAIKKRIKEIVIKGNMKDLLKGDKKIKIQADDLAEPSFELDSSTGKSDRVYIGNKDFHRGQKVRRPSSGQGKGGREAGNGGEGEDDFEFVLHEKEFLNLFFEDLELPEAFKKQFTNTSFEIQHAGYSRSGGPTSLNIKKTMLNAIGRKAALKNKRSKMSVEEYLAASKALRKLQYIEDIDLRYNFKEKVEIPATKCVMFALMDVSGSMGEREKDIAKRFFILLKLFLEKNYEQVDIIFVRHAETAEVVDEQRFFHDRKSGGTIISTGYEVILETIQSKYNPEQWNIYIAQASDGDNWGQDMPVIAEMIPNKLLPLVQYFAYINIHPMFTSMDYVSDTMELMDKLMTKHKNIQARAVKELGQIWEVFRSLFKKKETT